jgi:general secretion pathway protein E/type IV pilus assembly protein PilB
MNNAISITLNTQQIQSIDANQAWSYFILPKAVSKGERAFYISSEKNANDVEQELELIFNCTIVLESKPHEEILQALNFYYRKKQSQNKSLQYDGSGDFLLKLIYEASEMGSSDIHIEAFEKSGKVRFRLDGKLTERYQIEKKDYPALINKVKIRANLDIAEKRLPQDGRIFFEEAGKKFDIRVSSLPTLHGEKVVLRLLNKDGGNIDIDVLGMKPDQQKVYLEGIKKPHGIVLISGPTGSGKTTTLYATLKLLNKETTNILTIEDPIEYTLEGVNQVQLKESIGMTFASALRTFLRQDPDIIMLGEIRDAETAQMAIRAALTGHLVLSTIHTNSAWGSISRLMDMGVQPFLISNTLNLSVAQRLVRKLCPHCKEEKELTTSEFPMGYTPKENLHTQFIAKGCDHCYYTGYAGRTALYEIIPVNQSFAGFIKEERDNVEEELELENIPTLANSAFQLFKEGETSLEEIYPILLNSI